jgi:MFS transporter, ACDE family, multidrug resistance protein
MALTALCYNWGFFTVLGYAPFPMNLSPIKLGLVFTGWGIMVAIFAVFGAPRLQERFGIARTMYANLAVFAVIVLVIAAWTTDRAVLIPAVIASGVVIGINNTVTTQAVMTVAPVEKPVASAAYSFVRFIGGGLAPYAAGRLVLATNIHVPFYIGAGAIALGIVVLATAHRLLGDAERVQAEQVAAAAGATEPHETASAVAPGAGGPIVAAVDGSPAADLVTEAAAELAGHGGRLVYVVHAQEGVAAGDSAVDAESADAADAIVRRHLDQLAARDVPATGEVLRQATDHGTAGRLVADYATRVGAATIVAGPSAGGELAVLMDESAGQELARHARAEVRIVGADLAPDGSPAAPAAARE